MTMPAPIPIARMGSDDPMIGSSSMGTSFGSSFLASNNTPGGSASFREAMAMATNFGRDVNDLVDYSGSKFGSSVDSEMTILPSTSFGHNDVETSFCRNFNCCDLELKDLHDLLQHYEEAHVRFDDDGMPGMIEDDGTSSGGSVSTPSSMPPSPRTANARNSKAPADPKRRPTGGLNIHGSDGSSVTSEMDSPIMGKGKKRSFGQYDAAMNSATPGGSVHQSLRRALIDGGVGARNNRSSPSIYSANSPFSTPGSSIPGTPLGDDTNDFAFSSNGLSAFSSLSLRPGNGDSHLPACAPPNLFFPTPGSSSAVGANATTVGHPAINALPSMGGTSQPPAKRERISSTNGDKVDKDSVEKPFKCPNPGCDKAYKQANGLKYHRLHGSCNKNLSTEGGITSPSAQGSQPSASKPASPAASAASPSTATVPVKASPTVATSSAKAGSPAQQAQSQQQPPPPPPQQQQRPAQPAAPSAATKNAPPQGTFPGQAPKQQVQSQPQPPQQQQSKPGVAPTNAAGAKPAPNNTSAPPASSAKPIVGKSGPSRPNGGPAPSNTNAAANNTKPGAFPLPGNINSAALAAATALLQRGGPLPPSIQGQHGPIDSAALLKTLQMLQQQMAQQQNNNGASTGAGQAPRPNAPGNATNGGPRPAQQGGANNANNNMQRFAPKTGNQSGPAGAANNRPSPGAPGAQGNRPIAPGPRSSPGTGPTGTTGNAPRTGNLTNTQPGSGLSATKSPPSGVANSLSNGASPNTSSGGAAPPNRPNAPNGGNTSTSAGVQPAGSQQPQVTKSNAAPSGITPQMLAAAQQAAAQKRAQQAGAQQRPS